MRKLSRKWPKILTFVSLMGIGFHVLAATHYGVFDWGRFFEKVFGYGFWAVLAWAIYGVACLFARTWVNCGDCKFSEDIQDSNEIKCRLTGYNYPITYSCKNSKPKEVEGAKDRTTTNC